MGHQLIDEYSAEATCLFKGNNYSARDNGSVYRHPMKEGRTRALDGIWTFGKINKSNGYMEIASVRVHQIIATAFLDPPPTPTHVVDHIDTNKQNNRPENLRWVTRFENILLNPITRKKIELLCGHSIEEVLADISILHNTSLPSQFLWMKTVSTDEAKKSLQRWNNWVDKLKPSIVGMPLWENNIRQSRTFRAAQKDWHLVGTFPLCPVDQSKNTLQDYQNNLKPSAILFQRDEDVILVSESAINDKTQTLVIKCNRSRQPKSYCLITVVLQNGWFIHSMKVYFDKESLEKYYTLALGKQWEGGTVFNDLC